MSKKAKEKQNGMLWAVGREFFGYLLDLEICIYMFLVIAVLPFYHQEGFLHIGTDKANFLKQLNVNAMRFLLPVLAVYLLFGWLEQRKEHKRAKWDLSVTDKFALLYGAMLIVSYMGSAYRETALWGADGWFLGLLPQLFWIGVYFLVSRFWEVRKWMFVLFAIVSAAVFALGYLNRFGIYPIDMKWMDVEFISTIGNINWYCGYLVSVLFGACYLLWQSEFWHVEKDKWKHTLLLAYVAIGFATLVTQGSMSGLFTLAVMFIVMFCLSAESARRMQLFAQELLLFSAVCLFTYLVRNVFGGQITYTDSVVELLTDSLLPIVMVTGAALFLWWVSRCEKKQVYSAAVFRTAAKVLVVGIITAVGVIIGMIVVNTLHPGSIGALSEYSMFTFSPSWGSNRATTWKAGVLCFGEQDLLHKLIGVGPDCMSVFLSQGSSEELRQIVRETFGYLSLTNAHNEWLTVLVNTGILGLISYVGMMGNAIGRYVKSGKEHGEILLGACGFCLLAYTINNLFSFQQSVSTTTIFVIMGMGEALLRKKQQGLES